MPLYVGHDLSFGSMGTTRPSTHWPHIGGVKRWEFFIPQVDPFVERIGVIVCTRNVAVGPFNTATRFQRQQRRPLSQTHVRACVGSQALVN